MKTQSEIRLKILKVRNALNKAEVINASKIIEQKFLSLSEIKDKTNYFVYNSFKNEVQTSGIISALKSDGKTVSCPLIKGDDMLAVIPTSTDFILDKFGIKTPKNYDLAQNIEVGIIPLIACDTLKNRIGFGKGYYDKFLKDKNILKIGLCYNFQVVDGIVKNEWDVPLDIIITETKII